MHQKMLSPSISPPLDQDYWQTLSDSNVMGGTWRDNPRFDIDTSSRYHQMYLRVESSDDEGPMDSSLSVAG